MHTGYDLLYPRLHGGYAATTGEIYPSMTPISHLGFTEYPCSLLYANYILGFVMFKGLNSEAGTL